MDPELVLLDRNEPTVIAADNYLVRTAKFGVDGHRYIAELRPEPAETPKDLVTNLRRTLAFGGQPILDLKWLAGPFKHKKPLGGHIHFGSVYMDERIREALDGYLPILLSHIEDEKEATLRRCTTRYEGIVQRDRGVPYGLLGDFREKKWGFEYRTPSSFILTPAITRGVLTAAKAIVLEELESGAKAFSKLSRALRKRLSFSPQNFHKLDRTKFATKIPILRKLLFGMKYFEYDEGRNHKAFLSYLFDFPIKKGYSSNRDLKTAWKLYPNFLKKETKRLEDLKSSQLIIKPFKRERTQDEKVRDVQIQVQPLEEEERINIQEFLTRMVVEE
jgi:hypothetical protein